MARSATRIPPYTCKCTRNRLNLILGDKVSYAPEAAQDRTFLTQAIDLSRHALEDEGKTPSAPSSSSKGKSSPPARAQSSNSATPLPTLKSWPCATPVPNSGATSWKTP